MLFSSQDLLEVLQWNEMRDLRKRIQKKRLLERVGKNSTKECLTIVDKKYKKNLKCMGFQENYQIIGLSIYVMIFLFT